MAHSATNKNRPKYLSLPALLFEIRLPLPGGVSILHGVSGLLLFLATVWLLYMLDRSLASPEGFEHVSRYVAIPVVKLALLVLVWAYCHHFCAGIRFLFLDLDLILDRFLQREADSLGDPQLARLNRPLDLPDNDRRDIVSGRSDHYDSVLEDVVVRLRTSQSVYNRG